MVSLGQVLDERRGFGPGFDFLRLFLALAVVGYHVLGYGGHEEMIATTPLWYGQTTGLPVFFALSGLLVAASGQRLNLPQFIMFRALRLMPALAVEVVFCALILGPIFTTLAVREYFSHAEFYSYFLNMIGWVHFELPGLFEYAPDQKVNAALWTIPYELVCYAFVGGLIITRIIYSFRWTLALVLIYFAMALLIDLTPIRESMPGKLAWLSKLFFMGAPGRCIFAFMLGVLAWQVRYKIPVSGKLFAFTSLSGVGIIMAGPEIGQGVPIQVIMMPGIVYWTMWMGLQNFPTPAFLRKGDYSYGVYLYHIPLIHVVNTLFPAIALGTAFGGWFTLALVFPLALGLAYLSWNFVEKPALGLRKKFGAASKPREEQSAEPATHATAKA